MNFHVAVLPSNFSTDRLYKYNVYMCKRQQRGAFHPMGSIILVRDKTHSQDRKIDCNRSSLLFLYQKYQSK